MQIQLNHFLTVQLEYLKLNTSSYTDWIRQIQTLNVSQPRKCTQLQNKENQFWFPE